MTSRTATGRDRSGLPSLRRWSRGEFALAALLLALAAAAWLLTHRLAMPDMRIGILTGAHPMDQTMRGPGWAETGLFLGTWFVMMAAMMLPAIAPFTVGMTRLMRAGGTGWSGTVALTMGYFVVWVVVGVIAFAAVQGLDAIARTSPAQAARAGAVILLAAGLYQFTPLKRVCLRHCRSPALLVLQHGQQAVRSRFGAFRAGLGHGGWCFGCCWALMAVLLAAGAMSLVWMGVIAAVVAVEKVHRHGETISRVFGGLLAVVGVVVLVQPGVVGVLG
ncbi:DUF2182 domain-containing protein [Pseudonocardia asaccharolytica]|uniref:Metal-binding protein n=1 Tax=Pseudonocardia asaccharolytica DSM 44247 = NBRC 16224 TaxID=1123024 RepID=A0A511CYV5_9PSEU|nr:DUF2182 domain-containing protein [Pseudonocardia asaccharolytica]GEL17742.1 hypothetical protein PA7_15790 [Pseudonocardia asaccharolytica DSM 44247 = NBRC 16224]